MQNHHLFNTFFNCSALNARTVRRLSMPDGSVEGMGSAQSCLPITVPLCCYMMCMCYLFVHNGVMEHLDEDFNDLSYIVFVYNSLYKITTPPSFHIRSTHALCNGNLVEEVKISSFNQFHAFGNFIF